MEINAAGGKKERGKKHTVTERSRFFVRILHTHCTHNRYTGIGIRGYYHRYYCDTSIVVMCRSVDVCAIHSNVHYNNGDERVYIHTAAACS